MHSVFNIERAFNNKKIKGWPKLFWAIDIHDVIIPGKYNRFNEGKELYPYAEEVLTWLMNRADMGTILWSSSHDDAVEEFVAWLKTNHNIVFDYINENPECQSNDLCNFNNKFYFNILLDDKAGMDGATDWLLIKEELIRLGEW